MTTRLRDGFYRFLKRINVNYVPERDLVEPPPEAGGKRLLFLIRMHYPKMIACSMVFTCCCLGIVTIPASVAGLSHVMTELVRKGNVAEGWWKSYFSAWISRMLDRALLYLVSVALPIFLYSYLAFSRKADIQIALGAAYAVWLLLNTVLEYFLVLWDVLDVKFSDNLRNAVLLLPVEWKRSLLLMLSTTLFVAAAYLLYPYCLVVLCFFGFACKRMLSSILIWPTVQKRLILKPQPETAEDAQPSGGAAE